MKLLLDTHAILWWLGDDGRLGAHARNLIADPDNDVLVSVVSLWEIVVKKRIGKLEADVAAVSKVLEQQGFVLLNIEPGHLSILSGLPVYPDHRDPFDHLLVAQAIGKTANLRSDDRNISRYPVAITTCSNARG